MKRIVLTVLVALGCAVASFAVTTPGAQASLFGGKAKGTPSPSPSPSALPTASPEPPSVAIPRLQAKLKANPNDQQTAAELAAQYLQINRPDLTLGITQKLLQAGDKTAQVYYYDGFAEETIGNIAAAQYDLEQAANLDPTNMGVLSQLADLYLKLKKDADAERVAKRAVTFNKTEPMALMTLGSVYASEGFFDKARTQFEAAYALNPKDVAPLYQIATTYAQQNNIPMALQTIDRALAVDPKSVQTLSYKASLYA
ncbi:MAG TPA: tetratricopeptide repeat protein, partial [Candidatus Baltobacteraceae bacterium]|nr:tetratricopeptide repeat protein [Candidatus Baltobacteraceae bacterium]